jgi:hypothetical protein
MRPAVRIRVMRLRAKPPLYAIGDVAGRNTRRVGDRAEDAEPNRDPVETGEVLLREVVSMRDEIESAVMIVGASGITLST